MSSKSLEVIILAAGKGTRMRSAMPKVLHEVGGLTLLEHVLRATDELNPERIHVVIGHGKDEVMQRFAGRSVNWVIQAEQLGTGHAVLQALPDVDPAANVLLLTADVPLIKSRTLMQLSAAMNAFSLALLTAEVPDPSGLGRILRDGDSVVGIIEHKDCNAEQLAINEINSGIMCARAGELADWLAALDNDNAQSEYYLTDIVELAFAAGNPIAAFHPTSLSEVEGINSRQQLAQVERRYQNERAAEFMAAGVTIIDPARVDFRGDIQIGSDTVIDVNVVLSGPTRISNNVYIGPNCVISAAHIGEGSQIHPHTVIEQAVIGDGVNIGPFARLRPGTDLANSVRIGNFVEIKNARLAAGAKVNHLSYVGDAQVGHDTNIGAGVITCNYDGANKHQTVIGDNVFVGSDAQLVAPVSVADGATIGAGSTITSDVAAGQLAISRGKQRMIDGWQRPVKADKSKK